MNHSPLSRYKKELAHCVSGRGRRKALLAAFQRSLAPFLEENAAPSYADLVAAFGPPEQMPKVCCRSIHCRRLFLPKSGSL